MKTAHWQWLGPEETIPGRAEPMRIGKRNLLNNFCIGIQGNWAGCTKCHAGYGWDKADYDFSKAENVDCLVCHDWSSSYVKGPAGLPEKASTFSWPPKASAIPSGKTAAPAIIMAAAAWRLSTVT